ncbi:MAG TPA: hypothetical protein IAC72_03030 [Candidatus Fimimonas merdipullorum]|uniref:Uncharacterized protein n=1 Tax=Candidatus Fimimonas merdipullorum TaxID=2840822 RepID=A0A9D1SPU6_9BACT|nr:hypothetical protein [Candidatus Fimimonas merdipullorum]
MDVKRRKQRKSCVAFVKTNFSIFSAKNFQAGIKGLQCNSGSAILVLRKLAKRCQTVGTAPYQKPLKGISGSTSTTKNQKGTEFSVHFFV